ncbi:MAG: hypothetical protein IJW67_12055 [Blautia sp.]|nr:hypothetical protein [Blautia sp.]
MEKAYILTALYDTTPSYRDWDTDCEFPMYKVIEDTYEVFWVEAENLEEAEKWLAINHPERYIGANFKLEGKYKLLPVPCKKYGKGNYESLEARIRYARSLFA